MTDIQLSGSTPDAQTPLFAKYLKLSAFGGYRIEIEHKALPDEKSVKQTTNRRGLSEERSDEFRRLLSAFTTKS